MSKASQAVKLLIRRYAETLDNLWTGQARRMAEALRTCLAGAANLLATRAAVGVLAVAAVGGHLAGAVRQAEGAEKPNVVYIMADDLGWADNDLAYNQAYAAARGDTDAFFETPNLRRLAGSGLTFTQACAPGSNCSPTRVSTLTGQSAARHRTTTISNSDRFYGGNYDVRDYQRNLAADTVTLGEALQAAGYATSHIGKWHVGEEGHAAADPTANGFDVNVAGGPFGAPQNPDQYFAAGDGSFTFDTDSGTPVEVLSANSQGGQYLTDRLTEEAEALIASAAAGGQPFFMNFWHYGVHTPLQAPSSLVNKYSNKLASGTYTKFAGLGNDGKDDVATYAAMVESVDDSLGAILDRLEDPDGDGDTSDSIVDETLVVFTSDHGGFNQDKNHYHAPQNMNGPLREGKGAPYEGGLRVPMVVGGAGVDAGLAGGQSDTPVCLTDWYPTLLGLAAAPGSGNTAIDGADISGVLDGSTGAVTRTQPLVWHVPHDFDLRGLAESGQDIGCYSAIREGDWKLVRYYRQTGLTETELYDLSSDVGETNDLAAANPQRVADMTAALDGYLASVDAQMPTGHERDRTGAPPLWAARFDHEPDRTDLNASISGQFGDLESLALRTDSPADEARVVQQALRVGADGGTGWMTPDHDFVDSKLIDAGGFTLAFDVNPVLGGNGQSSHWAAVSLGHSRASAVGASSTEKFNGNAGDGEFIIVQSELAFGLLFADDGTYAVRDDGAPVDLQPADDEEDRLTFDPGAAGSDKTYHVELVIELTDFAAGSEATAYAYVDGVQIDLNGLGESGLGYVFAWNTGSNYLNFEGFFDSTTGGQSVFDNIVVDAVPEPGMLALLALGAAGFARRRR